ncbi:hypothetical protein Tco_1300810 [Tanacetum coccineum]
MRMKQYLQCIDYTLWEIIENGNAPIVTKIVDDRRLLCLLQVLKRRHKEGQFRTDLEFATSLLEIDKAVGRFYLSYLKLYMTIIIMVFVNAAANGNIHCKVKTAKSMFVLLKDKVNAASILNDAIGVVSTA